MKFYLNGDSSKVVYLEETWIRGEFSRWCVEYAEVIRDLPGRARVAKFFEFCRLVPVEPDTTNKILSMTSDYNQFFIRARSLGTQLRMANVPSSVVDRAIHELKAASTHETG